MSRRQMEITPELMLRAYRIGLFPMAESRDARTLYWLDPEMRGVIPLTGFHLPRRLARRVRQAPYRISANEAFAQVIAACAAPRASSADSWINAEIQALFTALHRQGHAHSIEAWQGEVLVGGLYGVSLGGAFFGESMFSHADDASKIALVHLVARLRLGGFTLLDAQFQTAHLAQFGTQEVPRALYKQQLATAVEVPAIFPADPDPEALAREIAALRAEG
ncbi:leucyl/phenylalanyl-tRNA--protein transferase [Sediminicoccus rosea]|jgi:leucyl/phenylalanyl-tRNA--protein transferase|uniref:Leucyl/phenylalanyl-tRNA--protein transferase n=1 Tax=Sediminicoccus rosea TaxID=1225128 RepID=A0ABZ0PKD3_9PROT|nr:leucyl/phenylalanyl-tRNA--protein transferase [Sediminicoccus rosea]WPB85927.1 leucyl/phenylalanyl-tRNA--protein transferase [Sediminicoccus rosea]